MLNKAVLTTICLVFLAGATTTASAVSIDPQLQAILDAEDRDTAAVFPILLIFEDLIDPEDLELEIDTATPKKRRGSVIAALKKHARKVQEGAMNYLVDPGPGQIIDIQRLYMANAISFKADKLAIRNLTQLKGEATLYHDQVYDLIDTNIRPAGDVHDSSRMEPARDDTVWSVKWINADRVWNELGYTGDGILVGHIDSGVWLTHPDIANRLWVNPGEIPGNGIDDDENGYIDDINGYDFGDGDGNPNDDAAGPGHGTHTAGTVAGDGTNGMHTGVAPEASILVCKAFNSAGEGTLGMIWEAEQYCVENGARVMTMSLGIKGELPASYMRAERYNFNNIRAAGVLMFNSAGNEHYEFNPPIECGLTARVPAPWNEQAVAYSHTSGVVAVGGTGYMSNGAYVFSSRGPVNWGDVAPWNDWPYNPGAGLVKPDVSAPGSGVNSLTIPNSYSGNTWDGTSMACPHAAGVAALMLEKNPSLSPAGLDSIMELTATDIGAAGKDNIFGSGLINAFAAVNMVPDDQVANLNYSGNVVDPIGDGVLDPGETGVQLLFELTNASPVVDATGVTAEIAIVPNAYVTVADYQGSYDDIPRGGDTATNDGDPFLLNIASGAPQGFEFTVYLSIYADNGFERTIDVEMFVGLPEHLTHNVGNVYLTVTDQGIIGYMSDEQLAGVGMGNEGVGSSLFVGSFWAGNSMSYICGREYSGSTVVDVPEWEVETSPNGRVRDLGANIANQVFQSVFNDDGAAAAKGINVQQTSYAWNSEPYNDFVVLEYEVTNNGASTISNYRTGIFCDWDIGNSATNEAGTDEDEKLSYVYASGGSYFGVALLGSTPLLNVTVIKNETYVYPNGRIDDGFKSRFLSGVMSTPASDGPQDWSAVTSGGPFTLNPSDVITVAYAMIYGENLADLQANAAAARAAYMSLSPNSVSIQDRVFELAQNHPNPFNPQTDITFSVARAGHVQLAVYDTHGRLVRTLVSESMAVGDHTVTWNGRDESGSQMPSGVYFCKYISGDVSATRKMTLVK